ncbi:DUF4190 domain-containing protein [Salana multivorans]
MTTPNPYGPDYQAPQPPTGSSPTPGTVDYGSPTTPIPGMASPAQTGPVPGPTPGPTMDAGPYGTPYGSPVAPSPFQGASPYQTAPYPQTNQLATLALILSLVGLATWVTAPAGAICGHIALKQISQNPGQQGHGMALAGVIVGWVITALGIAAIAWFVWMFAVLAQLPNQY